MAAKKEKEETKAVAKGLKSLIADLSKSYGKAVITPANEYPDVLKIRTLNPSFDFVCTGGIPVNRITELFGDFSSLKTFHAQLAIVAFQQFDWASYKERAISKITYKTEIYKDKEAGDIPIKVIDTITPRRGYKSEIPIKAKRCAFVDIEGTFDRVRAEKIGIDTEGLLYMCPDSLSQAVDVTEALLSDPEISLVVIDSMSAVGSDDEVDSSMEDQQMATNARFWNKAMRKFQAAMNRNPEADITLIVINSAYEKVGMVFGDPTKIKNGNQLTLAKSMSIQHTGLKEIPGKDANGNDCTVGRNIKLKNKKNKVGRPFLEASFYFSYVDDGEIKAGTPDVVEQIITLGLRLGLIERSGAWFNYKEVKGNGMEGFATALKEKSLLQKLTDEVYERF